MSFPSAEDAMRLHERLLTDDPFASLEVCEAFLAPLTNRLERASPGADPHQLAEAAETALLDYCDAPQKYKPHQSALASYLLMLARADLANLQQRESRRQRRRELVELERLPGNTSQEQPLLRLVEQEETIAMRAAVDAVAAEANPKERCVLRLITEGAKATAPFAEALGITDRPVEEQQDEVLREKDKMKKRLKREYKRHG